jgi:HlyD family secretion protein
MLSSDGGVEGVLEYGMSPLLTRLMPFLACLALACSGGNGVEPSPTAAVELGRIERIVVATGTIEPEKEVEVRPRISGIVERVYVVDGDRVEQGQPLVQIERELLEARAKETRSRLEGSQVELRYAKIELERARALREGGAVAEQAYERAEAKYKTAQAAVSRDLAAVESLLGYSEVNAPMSGMILDVDVEEGDAVSSVTAVTGGSRLLTIAAANVLHLKGLVDENEIVSVAIGQPARVRTEAYGDKIFEGRVREISPIGERQQNVTYFEVEVLIVDEEASLLRTRMSADADIITQVVEETLLIPETALLYEGREVYVELVSGPNASDVERRRVSIGIVDSDRVQVLKGLQAGQQVRLK